VVLIGVSYAYWNSRDQPWTFTRVVGLALAIPALLGWMTARIQLGPSFALRAKAKELVTHGLYSKIRNPIYLFGSIFIVGLLLLFGKPAWLLILVVLVPLQVFRARKEAKVLEEKFGDAYRDYRGKTWF
jgi:protein-S-isoprenylcysteine O-methyltransferase Ste14